MVACFLMPIYTSSEKRPLISDHIKGPLVATFRSPLMKALDRSVETLGLWIVTSSVTFIKSVNQSGIKPCLKRKLLVLWSLKKGQQLTYWLVQTRVEWPFIKLQFWKFELSKNCDIRYVSKILSKNRYNGLNYAYITLGTMETRIILRIESVTCMLQFLKLMPTMKSISKVSRLL